MNWSEFLQKVPRGTPFTVEQATLYFPSSGLKNIRQNIFNWKKKGRLVKLRRNLYVIGDRNFDRAYLANRIYEPSYISLEYALSYYSLIPEAAFQITSITTNKTAFFHNELGAFKYRHIKLGLYFGYGYTDGVLIAEREKCLLDYCYLNLSHLTVDKKYLQDLRLQNIDQLNRGRLRNYLKRFQLAKLTEFIEFCLKNYE